MPDNDLPEPLDQASQDFLTSLSSNWTRIDFANLTDAKERALAQLAMRGLIQQRLEVTATVAKGNEPGRTVNLQCRVSGDYGEELKCRVIEGYFGDRVDSAGCMLGHLRWRFIPVEARLTVDGERAQQLKSQRRANHAKPLSMGKYAREVVSASRVVIEKYEIQSDSPRDLAQPPAAGQEKGNEGGGAVDSPTSDGEGGKERQGARENGDRETRKLKTDAKILAAVNKHHSYDSGTVTVMRHDPIVVRKLAERARMPSRNRISGWFKAKFGSYEDYVRHCEDKTLAQELARVNGDKALA
jgi:hypothetical protein